MKKNLVIAVSVITAIVLLQSCASPPEKSLLARYFNASRFNDNDTMSSIAIDPVKFDVVSWEMISVSPERIEPAVLPELNAKELDLKKQYENHVGPTVEAKDALDAAKEEFDLARTPAARAAAKKKVDALQAKYDAEFQIHKDLRLAYNEAKAAAQNEEELTTFSLGVRELMNIRSLTGSVHFKEVEVKIKVKQGAEMKYRIYLKRYQLKDETNNLKYNGRWVITKFESLD